MNIVEEIRGSIIKECLNSPMLVNDIANMEKYSSDRDTQRADCKSAVFHADFFLFWLLGCGSSMGSATSA